MKSLAATAAGTKEKGRGNCGGASDVLTRRAGRPRKPVWADFVRSLSKICVADSYCSKVFVKTPKSGGHPCMVTADKLGVIFHDGTISIYQGDKKFRLKIERLL